MTIKSGVLIPLLIMLPNVVWMLRPRADAGEHVTAPRVLTMVENVGRVAVLILPLFFTLDLSKERSTQVVIGMGLALTAYYVCWMRYFLGGRSPELLRAPLLGLPLPMAVVPTVFFVLSSYLMGSWSMLGASILFGVAHIWVAAVSL